MNCLLVGLVGVPLETRPVLRLLRSEVVTVGARQPVRDKRQPSAAPDRSEKLSLIRVPPRAHARLKSAAAARGVPLGEFMGWLILDNETVRRELQKIIDSTKEG